MSKVFPLLASLLLLLSLSACPGDDEADDDLGDAPDASAPVADAAPVPTSTEVCAAVSEIICNGLGTCDCRFDVRPYDAAGCVAARTADCVASFATRIDPDITAGFAAIFPEALAACVFDLGTVASACRLAPTPNGLPFACDALVGATADVGEICMLSGGGLAYCAQGAGLCIPGDKSPPVCTALPVAAEACLADRCAAGLVCVADVCRPRGAGEAPCEEDLDCDVGLVCNAGACAPPALVAATCGETSDCKGDLACVSDQCVVGSKRGDECRGATCSSGQACGRAPETRTCKARVAAGQPCEADACVAGHVCSGEPAVCVPLPTSGQPCLEGTDCADGLTCLDGMGTCGPLPGLGQACAMGNKFCAPGLGCDQLMNLCVAPGGLGDVCPLNPPDYLCGPGLGCNFGMTSICVAQQPAGGDCTNNTECLAATFCDLSTLRCAARYGDGAACSAGNECLAGSECEVGPDGAKCRPIPGTGAPCVSACSAANLACQGPGGECAAAICVVP